MIFVDTAFWVALGHTQEARHREARELMRVYGDRQLLTSNHVRGETWTMVRRRSGHAAATAFLDLLGQSARVRVVFVTSELEGDAVRWLRRHDERVYSFVDATSFALMRAMRINEALTFDDDFAAAGFAVARLDS